jgi:hypothetical protein
MNPLTGLINPELNENSKQYDWREFEWVSGHSKIRRLPCSENANFLPEPLPWSRKCL